MDRSSRIQGFFKQSVSERREKVKQFANLKSDDIETLNGGLNLDSADRMIENVIGYIKVPMGVATNFLINGKDYLIPMATEEPSVVAAASNAARLVRQTGGFTTSSTNPVMIGQIQVVDIDDIAIAQQAILKRKREIISLCNDKDPVLVKFGGGAKELHVRLLEKMIVIHLLVDTRDAMGANAVNTMCEAVAPLIEKITGGRVVLRILSNLAVERLVRAHCVISKKDIGEKVVDGVLAAYDLATSDQFRAVTHNKGIMNGITAVVLATGNDTRAIEAGAHAFASYHTHGRYTSLTTWTKNANGDLEGSIELPMAVGLIGGATKTHPTARTAVKILNVSTARELGEVIAAIGLAQNFGALRALATEGIQRGHMALHAKNIAVQVGAVGDEVDKISDRMVKEKSVSVAKAKEILEEIRNQIRAKL